MNQLAGGEGRKRSNEHLPRGLRVVEGRHCLAIYKRKVKTDNVSLNYIQHSFREAHIPDSKKKATKAVYKTRWRAPVCLVTDLPRICFKEVIIIRGHFINSTAKVTKLHEFKL